MVDPDGNSYNWFKDWSQIGFWDNFFNTVATVCTGGIFLYFQIPGADRVFSSVIAPIMNVVNMANIGVSIPLNGQNISIGSNNDSVYHGGFGGAAGIINGIVNQGNFSLQNMVYHSQTPIGVSNSFLIKKMIDNFKEFSLYYRDNPIALQMLVEKYNDANFDDNIIEIFTYVNGERIEDSKVTWSENWSSNLMTDPKYVANRLFSKTKKKNKSEWIGFTYSTMSTIELVVMIYAMKKLTKSIKTNSSKTESLIKAKTFQKSILESTDALTGIFKGFMIMEEKININDNGDLGDYMNLMYDKLLSSLTGQNISVFKDSEKFRDLKELLSPFIGNIIADYYYDDYIKSYNKTLDSLYPRID